jgi:Bacterial extracellular solute-binding proteins, family 5 Middle
MGLAVGAGAVWVTDNYGATVLRIDPAVNRVVQSIPVGNAPTGVVVGDGSVSLPSPTDGGTTYTFQLRRGIRYSNGEPLRPEDFRRALERDLILGPNNAYGGPFADVIGGAACVVHPSRCDLSRGVVVNDAANTVTFRLVVPNPEFLERLTLPDAVAVPADTPLRDIGLRPVPTTGPYEFAKVTPPVGWLVRNPYFHEWSHAARPNGYADRIVYHLVASPSAEIAPIERGRADYALDGVPPHRLTDLQTRFASQLYVNPSPNVDALVLNTRVAPFNDIRVRQAISYAVDRAKIARLVTQGTRLTCQTLPPYLPGYDRFCPYTLDPNRAGIWHAPNLAKAERLIALSHTRGTPITLWNLGQYHLDYTPAVTYLVGLLERAWIPNANQGHLNRPQCLCEVRRLARQGTSRDRLFLPSIPVRVPIYPGELRLPIVCAPLARERKPLGILQPPARLTDPERARRRGQQLAGRRGTLGAGRPHSHRPGGLGSPHHPERDGLRVLTRRQLPIQLPAGRAARPVVGAPTLKAQPHGRNREPQ